MIFYQFRKAKKKHIFESFHQNKENILEFSKVVSLFDIFPKKDLLNPRAGRQSESIQ